MSDPWRTRAYTAAEAADLAGIRRSVLDMWTIRQPADLFSEKRKHRRWYSPQDIAVLALAWQLERAGQSVLLAIATAFTHLQQPPEPDAIFVTDPATTSCEAGRFISDRAIPRLQIDRSIILIPAGAIVARITAACADLRAA